MSASIRSPATFLSRTMSVWLVVLCIALIALAVAPTFSLNRGLPGIPDEPDYPKQRYGAVLIPNSSAISVYYPKRWESLHSRRSLATGYTALAVDTGKILTLDAGATFEYPTPGNIQLRAGTRPAYHLLDIPPPSL